MEKGESRKWLHWFSAVMVFVGSWISGFFIIVTDAWMQHPVAYDRLPNGQFEVLSFWQLLLNPWALLQYAHNMTGAVVTGSFVMARWARFICWKGARGICARIFLKVGVIAGVIAVHRSSSFPPATCTASTWRATSRRPLPAWKGCSRPRAGAGWC
jgi:cytochrome d ubiquinol oxidase subunit I